MKTNTFKWVDFGWDKNYPLVRHQMLPLPFFKFKRILSTVYFYKIQYFCIIFSDFAKVFEPLLELFDFARSVCESSSFWKFEWSSPKILQFTHLCFKCLLFLFKYLHATAVNFPKLCLFFHSVSQFSWQNNWCSFLEISLWNKICSVWNEICETIHLKLNIYTHYIMR